MSGTMLELRIGTGPEPSEPVPEMVPEAFARLVDLADRLHERNEDLERERAELWGRCGYLQGKVAQLEQQLALSAGTPEPENLSPATGLARPPWWRRWLRLEHA